MLVNSHSRICFRVDGSHFMGSGHIMRCVNLATGLQQRGAEITFLCRPLDGHYCNLLTEKGFKVCRLPDASLTKTEQSNGESSESNWLAVSLSQEIAETHQIFRMLSDFDWIIVDHYGLDARWESAMRPYTSKILVIDDLANRSHDCDLLIDQNYFSNADVRYVTKVPSNCSSMLGPKYALLQKQYAELHPSIAHRSGKIKRILVSFGGHGFSDLVMLVINAFLALAKPNIEMDVILNKDNPQYELVQNAIANEPAIHLHERQPSLAKMMANADLAIGASGATTWERLCMGLPSIVISLADNQTNIAHELNQLGLIQWLGNKSEVNEIVIKDALNSVFNRTDLTEWSQRCWQLVDGNGVFRVLNVILSSTGDFLSLRPAEASDEDLLLEWANEGSVRKSAFTTDLIDSNLHNTWFKKRLQSPDQCRIYIAELAGSHPIGQVRFERNTTGWSIDYSVDPLFRGRGFGKRMLAEAIELVADAKPARIYGEVKPENVPSLKVFDELGFIREQVASDRVVYSMYMGEV